MFGSIFFAIVGTLLVLFLLIYKYISTRNQDYWPKRHVYLLPFTKIFRLSEILLFKIPPHEFEQRQYDYFQSLNLKNHPRYYGTVDFGRPTFVVQDLDLIKQILVKDFDHFVNRGSLGDFSKTDPLFHRMLSNQRDQEWKDLRAALTPTFTTGKIRQMYSNFSNSSNKLSEFIKKELGVDQRKEVQILDFMNRYTMDVISSAAFGLDSGIFTDTKSTFYHMGKKFQNLFEGKNIIKLVVAMIWPKAVKYLNLSVFDRAATEFFGGVVHSTITHRQTTGEKRNDFLQLLIQLQSKGENTEEDPMNTIEVEDSAESLDSGFQDDQRKEVQMTEELIVSQALLFFLAGFDTTESLLLFAAYELAVNPEVQEKLYQELREAEDESGNGLDYETIMKCQYLDQVVREVLRKYPPVVRTERVANKPYKIPNSKPEVILETGMTVAISIYGIHHDKEIYPNPEKFDPERFSEENKAKRHPYAWLPFVYGPRSCIGNRFAMAEGKSAIAHLILNFQLSPGKKTKIPLTLKKPIIKPEGGVWLEIRTRNY